MRKNDGRLIGLLTDTHFPNHDEEAVEWWKDWIRTYRPHKVVHLGDMFDIEELSRFPKPMHLAAKLKETITSCRKIVYDFDRFLRGFGISWELLSGNHSDRLPKYLWRKAPELAELECLRLSNLFEIPSNVTVHPPDHTIIRDGVLLMHGVRYSESAVTYNLRYAISVAQGHSHRASIRHRRLPGGQIIRSAELGCLCAFDVPYVTRGMVDWSHALGYIENGALELIGKD